MAKKIFVSRSSSLGDIMGYTIPRLHEGKDWYIDFKAFDPETGQLKRKKYFVPKLKKKSERRAVAYSMIEQLTRKLREGWTPFADISSIRGTNKLDEMLDKYIHHCELSLRKTSMHNYRSRASMLREYFRSLSTPPLYCYQYTRGFVMDYLDWLIDERGVSARTRNNYRGWCGSFAEFLIERECIKDNPVSSIKHLKESAKYRQPLSEKQLKQLNSYLMRTDKHFLLACMMEYYTFIRPNELRHIRIKDISVMDQTVFIPAEVSKNKTDGKVSLNKEILKLMIDLRCLEKPGNWYLFGPETAPSTEQAQPDHFNKRFAKVRKSLKFGDEIKFYSLKDTGIKDLGEAAGIITARDQARHSDVATTNIYLQGRDRNAPDKAKLFTGTLKATEELTFEDSGHPEPRE